MEFINAKNLIYKKTADRIRSKIKESGKSHFDIYPGDEKIISRILNCKIYKKKNPYLIQDAVLDSYHRIKDEDGKEIYEHVGIVPILGYKDDKKSVLWGTSSEINEYLPELFRALMYDLIENPSDIPFSVEDILCDHVKYSKYHAYWNILFDSDNSVPAFFYGIFEDEVVEYIDIARDNAIDFLFIKPGLKAAFFTAFTYFISSEKADSFSCLDKKLYELLLYPEFIKTLEKYLPREDSLGLRVRNIVLGDLSQMKALVFIPQDYNTICERLINTSSEYIDKLEEYQNEYIENRSNI